MFIKITRLLLSIAIGAMMIYDIYLIVKTPTLTPSEFRGIMIANFVAIWANVTEIEEVLTAYEK